MRTRWLANAIIREGSEDTGDQYALVDLYVRPGGAVVGEHVHSYLRERFQVISGQVGFRLDGREEIAGPGQAVMVEPGKPHYFWNAGREEAHVLVQVWPARRFELLIQTLFGLARDGKTNANGMPNLLQLAVIAQEFDREIRFTSPPRIAQRVLFGILAPVGRIFGYRAIYRRYSGITPHWLCPDPAQHKVHAPTTRGVR
jgi:quercetin dioxygenase-like cupin family protein